MFKYDMFDSGGSVQRDNYALFRDIVTQALIPAFMNDGGMETVAAAIFVELSEMGVDKNPFGRMSSEDLINNAVAYCDYHFNGAEKPEFYRRYVP